MLRKSFFEHSGVLYRMIRRVFWDSPEHSVRSPHSAIIGSKQFFSAEVLVSSFPSEVVKVTPNQSPVVCLHLVNGSETCCCCFCFLDLPAYGLISICWFNSALNPRPFVHYVQVCGISLPLPPKKLIGNMDREFIAERQKGLQAYLDTVTQHPLLSTSLTVKKFLDPNNYSANYTGDWQSTFF